MQERAFTETRKLAEQRVAREKGQKDAKVRFPKARRTRTFVEKGTKGRKDQRPAGVRFEDGSHGISSDAFNALHRRLPRPGRVNKP